MAMWNELKARLKNFSRPVILDGATGTELARRGIDLNMPSWTATIIESHPDILRQVHRDYVDAGAEIITANTFRTHERNLDTLLSEKTARELTVAAVDIARDAAGGRAIVAGSVAPIDDCYSPHLTRADAALHHEHLRMAENLAAADVDVVLIETQITIREAVAAAQAVAFVGLPMMISFTCDRDGNLLSGESLTAAVEAVLPHGPACILVNCIPVEEVIPTLRPVRLQFPSIPLGAYANTGRLLAEGSWESTEGEMSAEYAEFAASWKEFGLTLIGGCCGTTPTHVSDLCKRV